MKKSKIILRVLLVLVGAFAVFGAFSIVHLLFSVTVTENGGT